MKTHLKKEHGVDMWRDGPSHRVQEFDDVRCQMKRRKNPQTQSIQRFPKDEVPVDSGNDAQEKALPGGEQQNPGTAQNTEQSDNSVSRKHKNVAEDQRQYREEYSHEQQRGLMERGGLGHQEMTNVNESPNDIVGIPLTNRQHSPHDIVGIPISAARQQQVKSGDNASSLLDQQQQHQGNNGGHQIQNCLSSPQTNNQGQPCAVVQVRITEESAHHHDMHRSSHDSTAAMHYTPQYLPVSSDMSHISQQQQHMPGANNNSNHSTGVSRYNDGGNPSRYPHMSSTGAVTHHEAMRQGASLHHDLQLQQQQLQGVAGAGIHHSSVPHPRYTGWPPPPPQAERSHQVYIPGEMGPGILGELMKLGNHGK